VYFLIIAVLQSIPLISPLTPFTAIAPLVLVLSVGLLREAVEDRKRKRSDMFINHKQVVVLRNREERCIRWEQIKVGDIIKVVEREMIPADGILLCSSEEDGSCFLDTTNLDGEANLKSHHALRCTLNLDILEQNKLKYFIQCEQPDHDLYKFSGTINIDSKLHSLNEKQFLLRGSTLMNTKWIKMLIVYTGHETKIMQNARDPHHKMSHVEKHMSKTVLTVFLIQIVLSVIGAICHHAQNSKKMLASYLSLYLEQKNSDVFQGILTFLTYIVLLNTLIPISLVVSVEVIKQVHARFINWDEQMRIEGTNEGAIANTSSLTDELGQVKYIFTDKTGTLTQNQMEFRKCSVNGTIYLGENNKRFSSTRRFSIPKMIQLELNKRNSFHNSSMEENKVNVKSFLYFRGLLSNIESKERKLALAMALCHTVICEKQEKNDEIEQQEVQYNSDSPDECALVRGAAQMGMKLIARDKQVVTLWINEVKAEKGTIKNVSYTCTYEILRVFHFSSDRKRMSVIVRDGENHLKLITKGADTVIFERCEDFASPRKVTMEHVNQFAIEGFRTLLYAERSIDLAFYEAWEQRWQEAELDIHSKVKRMDALIEELETKLTLIGATAVEDKLQEGVPETISLFQQADIKIWVLTGDKLETSVEMGKVCGVIQPGMREIILKTTSEEETLKAISEASHFNLQEPHVLIIDGASLNFALLPNVRKRFLELALYCSTVIACRTSPMQKALVVELIKDEVKCATLAVGDGANDVSMIRAAHVGVGVMGQEGMQAVRSSDYAIQQFSHLGRLVLHHGRLSYIRVAGCINYFLYKNIVFTLPQFIFGIVSAFSGQTFYCDLYISAYNVVFTALPVVTRAIMEMDLPELISENYPQLYRAGPNDEYFSLKSVSKASILALVHAIILTVIPLTLFQGLGAIVPGGFNGDIWSASVASFFYIVPIVHFQIYMETLLWNKFVTFAYAISLGFFIFCVAIYNNFEGTIQGVWGDIFFNPQFWLGFFLCTVLCLMPWLTYVW
jgi:phospholipid-translocating P-type ATPase (flippase)